MTLSNLVADHWEIKVAAFAIGIEILCILGLYLAISREDARQSHLPGLCLNRYRSIDFCIAKDGRVVVQKIKFNSYRDSEWAMDCPR